MAEQKLFFEDVTEGDQAPVLEHKLNRTDLARYAGASGDYNPMHHDEVKAQKAGMPSVFGHGMFSMGVLGRAVTDYIGIGNLRRFQVRFTKQSWPDDVFTTSITVAGKREDDGEQLVDLEVALNNQNGDSLVIGEATAALPSRG